MLYYNEVPRTTLKEVRTTIMLPGSIDTELTEGISGSGLKSAIDEDMKIAIEHASIARAIAFAIEQPSDVAINEMIIRPTVHEL
jgi:NADP-dependent 3-hydroxy acid dehydrogenase YdfG